MAFSIAKNPTATSLITFKKILTLCCVEVINSTYSFCVNINSLP